MRYYSIENDEMREVCWKNGQLFKKIGNLNFYFRWGPVSGWKIQFQCGKRKDRSKYQVPLFVFRIAFIGFGKLVAFSILRDLSIGFKNQNNYVPLVDKVEQPKTEFKCNYVNKDGKEMTLKVRINYNDVGL